jgi:hypothetical protein
MNALQKRRKEPDIIEKIYTLLFFSIQTAIEINKIYKHFCPLYLKNA